MSNHFRICSAVLVLALLASAAMAADSPQFRQR